MPITLSPLTPGFACEVGDVDLTRPLEDADLAAVRDAFARFAVLVFPSQDLTVDQHLAFARQFGPLERSVATVMPGETLRVRPEFADLRAAWDALDEATRTRIDGLIAEHSLQFSRRRLGFADWSPQERVAFAPVARPLVRAIPESGRRSLYLASHIGRVRGLPDDEAEALFARLVAHATERRFTYLHRWRVGDLVMWDNRCTMHRGTEFDDTRWPRDMQRATTSDVPDAFDAALRAAGYGTAAEDAARSAEVARAEAARAAA
jgi:alpha-ketoglutarate-dependent 2,4-dichlorophenoxyacetate dioxygenase